MAKFPKSPKNNLTLDSNFFIKIDIRAFNCEDLNLAQTLFFSYFLGFADRDLDIFVSDKLLAKVGKFSERQAKRELRDLEKKGYISRHTKGKNRLIKVLKFVQKTNSTPDALPNNTPNFSNNVFDINSVSRKNNKSLRDTDGLQCGTSTASYIKEDSEAISFIYPLLPLSSTSTSTVSTYAGEGEMVGYPTQSPQEFGIENNSHETTGFILRENNDIPREPTFSFSLSADAKEEKVVVEVEEEKVEETGVALEAQPVQGKGQGKEAEAGRASRFGTKGSDLSQTSDSITTSPESQHPGFIQADLDIINLDALLEHGFMASDIREMLYYLPNPARLQESLDNFAMELAQRGGMGIRDKVNYFVGVLRKKGFYNLVVHFNAKEVPKEKILRAEYAGIRANAPEAQKATINPNLGVSRDEAQKFKKSHPEGFKRAKGRWLRTLEDNITLKAEILNDINRFWMDEPNWLHVWFEDKIWPGIVANEGYNFETEIIAPDSLEKLRASRERMSSILNEASEKIHLKDIPEADIRAKERLHVQSEIARYIEIIIKNPGLLDDSSTINPGIYSGNGRRIGSPTPEM